MRLQSFMEKLISHSSVTHHCGHGITAFEFEVRTSARMERKVSRGRGDRGMKISSHHDRTARQEEKRSWFYELVCHRWHREFGRGRDSQRMSSKPMKERSLEFQASTDS